MLSVNTFFCNSFNSVKAESMKDAAQIFALRMARRKYGKSGMVRTCQIGAYSPHNKHGCPSEFSAFIGITKKGSNETNGNNEAN